MTSWHEYHQYDLENGGMDDPNQDVLVRITCPDCGPVLVEPDVWSGGKPASGVCPTCQDRLYFEEPKDVP